MSGDRTLPYVLSAGPRLLASDVPPILFLKWPRLTDHFQSELDDRCRTSSPLATSRALLYDESGRVPKAVSRRTGYMTTSAMREGGIEAEGTMDICGLYCR